MPRTATGLYVPQNVLDSDHRQTQEIQAGIRQMAQNFEGVMRHWTEQYQKQLSDDRLEIIFFPPTAESCVAYGGIPGRYHVLRSNLPPSPPTLIPIEGDSGEFVEPAQWHIDRLRGHDLQNPQVLRAQRRAKQEAEAAKQRERERDTEERQEHLRDAYNARFRTSISMNRDTPWSQNARGRRARKA